MHPVILVNPLGLIIMNHTSSWYRQVWISAIISVVASIWVILNMPAVGLTKLFITMAMMFSFTMCFVLSKYIRDRQANIRQTPSFKYIAYGGTAIAAAMFFYGVLTTQTADNISWVALAVICWCYTQTCGFSLAKTLRDKFDATPDELTM